MDANLQQFRDDFAINHLGKIKAVEDRLDQRMHEAQKKGWKSTSIQYDELSAITSLLKSTRTAISVEYSRALRAVSIAEANVNAAEHIARIPLQRVVNDFASGRESVDVLKSALKSFTTIHA